MSTKGKSELDTLGVANRLVQLCGSGKFTEAQKELFADHAISIEPDNNPQPLSKGLGAILEKGKQFQSQVKELHSTTVGKPIVAQNHFAVAMDMDLTMKDGKRSKMDEVVVYKVESGKIVSEQFFY